MSLSNSRASYPDCETFYNRALEDPKGARALFPRERDAIRFRMRCNHARALDRRDSILMYKPGDPKYGISDWDCIALSIHEDTDGNWWVYGEKIETNLHIESLSDDEATIDVKTLIPEPRDPKLDDLA